ncbi:hypothetical protein BDQ17DRAFT_1411330, partial [Cyathus striatus]
MIDVAKVVELARASSFSNATGHTELKDINVTTAGTNVVTININSPSAHTYFALGDQDLPPQLALTKSTISEVQSSVNMSPTEPPPTTSVEPAITPTSSTPDPVSDSIPGLLGLVPTPSESFELDCQWDDGATTVNVTPSYCPEFLTL